MNETVHPRADLALHLTGDLEPGAAARLEAHLAECESCRRERAEIRATLDALRALDESRSPLPSALAGVGIGQPARTTRMLAFLRIAAAGILFAAGLLAGRELAPAPAAIAPVAPALPSWSAEPVVQRSHGLGRALLALKAAAESGEPIPPPR